MGPASLRQIPSNLLASIRRHSLEETLALYETPEHKLPMHIPVTENSARLTGIQDAILSVRASDIDVGEGPDFGIREEER